LRAAIRQKRIKPTDQDRAGGACSKILAPKNGDATQVEASVGNAENWFGATGALSSEAQPA